MKSEFLAGHLFCYPFMVHLTGIEPALSFKNMDLMETSPRCIENDYILCLS